MRSSRWFYFQWGRFLSPRFYNGQGFLSFRLEEMHLKSFEQQLNWNNNYCRRHCRRFIDSPIILFYFSNSIILYSKFFPLVSYFFCHFFCFQFLHINYIYSHKYLIAGDISMRIYKCWIIKVWVYVSIGDYIMYGRLYKYGSV